MMRGAEPHTELYAVILSGYAQENWGWDYESHKMLAQMVERSNANRDVAGSSPVHEQNLLSFSWFLFFEL